MAGVYPFRGVHYRDSSQLAAVTAPPYDVISPAQQEALYDSSPHNIVRLELTRREPGESEEGPYARAAALLEEWLKEEVLVRDSRPGFYVYRQTYTLPGQEPRGRTGFFAAVHLEDFSTGVIRPHEETFRGPKEDRLKLLRSCRANLSPIFGLYPDSPEVSSLLAEITAANPMADFQDPVGIRHQLWFLEDAGQCAVITRGLADRTILIADGHHRYETALAYRDECRRQAPGGSGSSGTDAWYEKALFVLVSMGDPGLIVLPTHRILRRVELSILAQWRSRLKSTSVTAVSPDPAAVQEALGGSSGSEAPRFVLVLPNSCVLIELEERSGDPVDRLDVSRLHREVLPALTGTSNPHELEIEYTQDAALALDAVHSGRAPAALLLNPTPVEKVDAVAASGARMPEKSTYFYPKLSTGLVIRLQTGTDDESGKEIGHGEEG